MIERHVPNDRKKGSKNKVKYLRVAKFFSPGNIKWEITIVRLPPTKAGRGSNILPMVCDDGLGGNLPGT